MSVIEDSTVVGEVKEIVCSNNNVRDTSISPVPTWLLLSMLRACTSLHRVHGTSVLYPVYCKHFHVWELDDLK